MKSRLFAVVSVACLAAVALSLGGITGAENTPVGIGDAGFQFKNLEGVDGKRQSLDDFTSAKAVVLSFTCNHCPVAVIYEDRFLEFAGEYKDKGVAFVGHNVDNQEAARRPAVKVRAKEKGFNFPYLYDPSQQSARAYGATCTPHLFVLDQERKIAYMGAFDDSNNPANVRKHYVKDAVDALLAGKTPAVPVTRQRGCSIKWD